MKYIVYFAPAAVLRELLCNAGIDAALAQVEDLQRRGFSVQVVDTSEMSPGELQGQYIEAIGPSVVKKYRVRQVFGSRRRAGWLFGRGVPALVVVRPSGAAEDVYPHERAGKLVTISEVFDSLRQQAAQAGAVTLRSARKRR